MTALTLETEKAVFAPPLCSRSCSYSERSDSLPDSPITPTMTPRPRHASDRTGSGAVVHANRPVQLDSTSDAAATIDGIVAGVDADANCAACSLFPGLPPGNSGDVWW